MAYERNNWRDRGYRGDYDRGRFDDDRGFIDRAGDEVRSWFGDEEAERRREADARRYERERGYADRDFGDRLRGEYRRYAGSYRDYEDRGRGYPGAADTWGGGSSDSARRFDRIDAGSTGTHGAHPLSAPAGTAFGGTSSSYARDAAILRQSRTHDPHYSEWRQRQISSLDRDYDDYRREHQSKFEQDFGDWRTRRQGQRQALGSVAEHMEVVGSDGQHIGTVDHVRGDRILLTKSDQAAGGRHHSIPCGWIDTVDSQVKIAKTAEEAQRAWRDEERSRALFEREDQGSDGPHVLNRSFSGTYGDDR